MESNEAPDETGGDEVIDPAGEPAAECAAVVVAAEPAGTTAEPEQSLPALVADTCSSMLDAVAIIDRIEAKQDAWKIEFLDQARRIAETTSHGVVTVGSKLTETQQRDMVRRSFVAEVAGVLRIPAVTAGQLINDSAVLMSRLPATLAALREGEISLRHARVIVDQVSTLDETNTLALEEAALPYAKKLTVSKFTQKARILRERIDADSIAERRVKSATDRHVEFAPARDGMAWLNLYTTAPEATSLYTAIRTAAMSQQSKTETRTLSQLGADVCADALAAGLVGGSSGSTTALNDSNGGTAVADSSEGAGDAVARVPQTAFASIKPTVLVTVPALTLLGRSEEPGDLAGYGPIDPDTARRLAGKSKTWYRLLTDPETGAPLSLGRTKYKPTKAMREYLDLRDGTCRWEGCNRQAKHCEIDHTKAWEHGGPTDCDNLSHLCPDHHRTKHETTWQAKQLPGGVIQWTSPSGRISTTEPENRLPLPPKPDPGPLLGARPPTPEPPAEPLPSSGDSPHGARPLTPKLPSEPPPDQGTSPPGTVPSTPKSRPEPPPHEVNKPPPF